MVILVAPTLYIIDGYLRRDEMVALARLGWEVSVGGALWTGAIALLCNRLITPELQTGLQSLRIFFGRGKSHALLSANE
jgi:hypothetical protein